MGSGASSKKPESEGASEMAFERRRGAERYKMTVNEDSDEEPEDENPKVHKNGYTDIGDFKRDHTRFPSAKPAKGGSEPEVTDTEDLIAKYGRRGQGKKKPKASQIYMKKVEQLPGTVYSPEDEGEPDDDIESGPLRHEKKTSSSRKVYNEDGGFGSPVGGIRVRTTVTSTTTTTETTERYLPGKSASAWGAS